MHLSKFYNRIWCIWCIWHAKSAVLCVRCIFCNFPWRVSHVLGTCSPRLRRHCNSELDVFCCFHIYCVLALLCAFSGKVTSATIKHQNCRSYVWWYDGNFWGANRELAKRAEKIKLEAESESLQVVLYYGDSVAECQKFGCPWDGICQFRPSV